MLFFVCIMYMRVEHGTFKMANNITFNKLNAPDFGMIIAGTIISAIGMLVGSFLCNKKRPNQNKEEWGSPAASSKNRISEKLKVEEVLAYEMV